MKIVETNGISFLEILSEGSDWYCGTDYSCGDLYEAEELFREGRDFRPNRLIFVHHPDGIVYEPIKLRAGQYFGRPMQVEGRIYILLVDFVAGRIQILDSGNACEKIIHPDAITLTASIPLADVKDCYNLLLRGTPLILTRQGGENDFEVIWPEKVSFMTDDNESFLYQKEEKLYFSQWFEDPDYREEVIVRDGKTGQVVERYRGSIFITPSGESWILF